MLQPKLCNDGNCDKTFTWTFTVTGLTMPLPTITPPSGSIVLPANTCTCVGDACTGQPVASAVFEIPPTANPSDFAIVKFEAVSTADEQPPPECLTEAGAAAADPVPCSATAQVTVADVAQLTWSTFGNNLPLDSAPPGAPSDNGGLRIFPGKTSPTDADAVARRNVDLVVTLSAPIDGCTVHFRTFDVDDPFDQNNPTMPNVQIIDGDTAGPDNRPVGQADPGVGQWSATTDANGEARVTVTVSMQPGNNYRAAASTVETAITGTTQAQADANTQPVNVVFSPMLTVWRKLYVETDTMVRPTFAQNTFTMPWNEPRQGPAATQVVFDVDDPATGLQTDDQQFTSGWCQLQDGNGNSIVIARIVDYATSEPFFHDIVTINIPDCGNNHSGLACLGGVTAGTAILSDDDLSVQATFTAGVWGCDDSYAGPPSTLLPPDLSAMQLRYRPAYIEPVHETGVSGTGGITTFLRNASFLTGGHALWDQVLPVRALPVSTLDFWTVMAVSSWQPEENRDYDPNSEAGVSPGLTLGINPHFDGETVADIGAAYTGICTVFKAVLGEINGREQYTVVHETGHTLGLAHGDGGLMCASGDCQTEPFTALSLKKLRDYDGP